MISSNEVQALIESIQELNTGGEGNSHTTQTQPVSPLEELEVQGDKVAQGQVILQVGNMVDMETPRPLPSPEYQPGFSGRRVQLTNQVLPGGGQKNSYQHQYKAHPENSRV